MSLNCKKLYEFGPYRLDTQKRQLWRGGEPVPLTAKATEILVLLVGRDGEIVSKDDLMKALWPDSYVEEANLTQNVFLLRKALGETAQDRNYIVTVPGKGYRFAAEVSEAAPPSSGQPDEALPVDPDPALLAAATSRRAITSRRLWVAAALLGLVFTSIYLLSRRTRPQSQPAPRRVVVAVLPFANLTGDPGQDYFIDGLTAEMIVQLGRFDPQRLGVISRSAVMSYKEGKQQVQRIAGELGVEYVLEGNVRRDADKVRITAELIQVRDQTHLWAREYDREPTRLLDLQAEIARSVADEVQVTLGENKKIQPAHQSITDPQTAKAQELYFKGRYFWNKRTAQGFQHALDLFQQAIAADPNYARAYAGMADCYLLMSSYMMVSPQNYVPKARASALQALQLDPQLAEAHTSLALLAENYDWDWQTADKEFRRAIELDPDYATSHQWYAEYLSFKGRFEEALSESERARQLDPLSLIIATDHASILYFAGQYAKAAEQIGTVLEMEPGFPRARGIMIKAYVEDRRFAEAFRAVDQWRAVDNSPWPWEMQAYIFGSMGERQKARAALAQAERINHGQRMSEMLMEIEVDARSNDRDRAFAWLERAYSLRSNALLALKVDHQFDPLHDDPRFQGLVRRIGLSQ